MSRLFSRGMARSWSGTLLASLVWIAFAPSGADAGCLSQHLKRMDAIERGGNHPDSLALLDLSDRTPSDLPRAPIPPCRGAFCSGSPATPQGQTPPPNPLGAGKWAACFDAAVPIPSQAAAIHPEDATLAPSTAVDSIFHPPRSL